VRKEATEAEQELVAEDAQFEDDGTLWQVYTTRWEPDHGVTLLYYDVDRIGSRLDDVGDDLEDPEDLLSDDDDVEHSSPKEVRAWVDEYQTQAQAQAPFQAQAYAPMPALPPRGGGGACRHFDIFRPRASSGSK
jgi:hypothetical protein